MISKTQAPYLAKLLTMTLAPALCAGASSEMESRGEARPSTRQGPWVLLSTHIGQEMGEHVDAFMSVWSSRVNRYDELVKARSGFTAADECLARLQAFRRHNFAEKIAFFVQSRVEDQELAQGIERAVLANHALRERGDPEHVRVSLVSHQLCEVTKDDMQANIHTEVSERELRLANKFASQHNALRKAALFDQNPREREAATGEMIKRWTRLMSCVAYAESLTSANRRPDPEKISESFIKAFLVNAPQNDGIKYYYDASQSDSLSRLNIGLFQFSPTLKGNVYPCLRKWKEEYPECPLPLNSDEELLNELAAPQQTFNAFCGIDKVFQSVYIQANTSDPRLTAWQNSDRGHGTSLVAPRSRCVTPHIHRSAYNHFGPFQKTVQRQGRPSNLDLILSCAMDEHRDPEKSPQGIPTEPDLYFAAAFAPSTAPAEHVAKPPVQGELPLPTKEKPTDPSPAKAEVEAQPKVEAQTEAELPTKTVLTTKATTRAHMKPVPAKAIPSSARSSKSASGASKKKQSSRVVSKSNPRLSRPDLPGDLLPARRRLQPVVQRTVLFDPKPTSSYSVPVGVAPSRGRHVPVERIAR